jgi:lysophospholipase L1-like esterase
MYWNSSLRVIKDSVSVARAISKHKGIRQGIWYFISFRIRGLLRALYDCHSVVYAKIYGKPLIHVIGDSHGKVFRGHRQFIVHHLGASTAHNLIKSSSTTNSNKKLFNLVERINSRDVVLLVFGEIDCRIHIYYQYKRNNEKKTIAELIDETISNYGAILNQLHNLNINFIVHGVPPATQVRNEYRYPFYASPEVHCQINALFNESLKTFCKANGYPYIDIHSQFSDDNGFMLQEYAADEIHLNSNVADYVKRELNSRFGINVH